MDAAKGRYYAFLDSDDIWNPNYLSTMKKHIDENTDETVAIVDTQKLPEPVRFNEALKALRDDYAYWLDIMKFGLTAYGYKDILGDYRMRDDSMTASKTKMIKPQWNIYRKVLHMNPISSAWYLFCWGINGIFKYKVGKKQ